MSHNSTSYQLPNLLAITKDFNLRTNRYCHSVTTASESWLLGLHDILDESERASIHSTKAGLLAALCFPTCDAPQLRLVTDFLSFLIYSNARMLRARDSLECGWITKNVGQNLMDGVSKDATQQTGVESLADNVLFGHVVSSITRLASQTDLSWHSRFTSSVHAFRAAQLQVIVNRSRGVSPDLEGYIELHRDASGLRMVFDLIELVEGLKVPVGRAEDIERLRKLAQCAADIIAWSNDIVSYNLDQSLGNKHNLIAVLMSQKGLSVQGAVNFAASLIKQAFNAFIAAERSVLSIPSSLPPEPSPSPSSSWRWGSRRCTPPAPIATPSTPDWDEENFDNVRLYVQGLRDCVVGSINWAYETELYFGQKGEEVRAFGWVFLIPVKDEKEKGRR